MISGQRLDPKFQSKVRDLIESGLSAEEVIQAFMHEDESRALSKEEGDAYSYQIPVPEKIKVIAQALAYRRPERSDAPAILSLINLSYRAECIGREAFRKDEPCITMSVLEQILFEDDEHQWLLVEAPDRSVEGYLGTIGESILGVMCYTTHGQSKRNGIVEGRLGSVRFFCVHPSYQRLYVGKRMLARLERQLSSDGCVRAMFSIPSPRDSVGIWLEDQGYRQVASVAYPAKFLGHELLNPDTPVSLDMLQKPLTKSKNEPRSAFKNDISPLSSGVVSDPRLDDSCDSKSPTLTMESGETLSDNTPIGKSRMVLPPHWRGVYAHADPSGTSTISNSEPIEIASFATPPPAPPTDGDAAACGSRKLGGIQMELSDTLSGLSFGGGDACGDEH